MKAYTTDEISYEITEFDIPRRLCATGIEYYKDQSYTFGVGVIAEWEPVDNGHYIGAIEGYIAGYDVGWEAGRRDGIKGVLPINLDNVEEDTGAVLDDDEYPAHRHVTWHVDGTLTLEARFGRNKKWVLAINRENDDLAKAWVEAWIKKETE